MDDCPLGPGVDGGGWRETAGSCGGDGREGRSILARGGWRETAGSGGGDGGEGRSILARGGWRETAGSGGRDGGEVPSILARGGWRETPGSGGGDGGEWEGDRCCNRIRFFSRNRAALSCLRHLLDHGLRPVSDMDLWMRQFNKEREETHFYHTFANEKRHLRSRTHVR